MNSDIDSAPGWASLPLDRGFAIFQLSAAVLSLMFGIVYPSHATVIAWGLLFTALFTSGGWFNRQLNSVLGWPSLFLILFGWLLPIIVSSYLWILSVISYFGGLIASDALRKKNLKNSQAVFQREERFLSLLFFILLPIMAMFLLAISLPLTLVADPWFWASIIPFALSGWLFPEIDARVGGGPGKSAVRGLVTYLAILSLGIIVAIYSGPVIYEMLGWILSLMLFVLLRAAFLPYPRSPKVHASLAAKASS